MHPFLRLFLVLALTSLTRWLFSVQVGELPSLHMRYDSSEALFLRKALNPRFAPHRAILRKSANPGGASCTAAATAAMAPWATAACLLAWRLPC